MLVYICSRYRAKDIDTFNKQLEYTKKQSYDEVLKGNDVITPHLYYPSFLNDNIDEERTLGMKSAIRLMEKCDEILVCTKYGISDGMKNEIEYANKLGMKIREVV